MKLYLSRFSSVPDFKLKKIALDLDYLKYLKNLKIIDCYLIVINPDNQKNNLSTLLTLLDYPTLFNSKDYIDKHYFFIGPRINTQSSWSSKVTDLATLAGIKNLIKIEKIKLVVWDKTSSLLGTDLLSVINSLTANKFIFDRLLEDIFIDYQACEQSFDQPAQSAINTVNYNLQDYKIYETYEQINLYNKQFNLALSNQELDYLATYCLQSQHILTDVELMMFAQANSEHCRHKIFNCKWTINNIEQEKSLFQMIKNTHQLSPNNTIVAYKDNASIVNNFNSELVYPDQYNVYRNNPAITHSVIKVETHNHPTAISPFPGAATGSGGEIRDEGATGRGAKPKVGLVGFSVSNLNLKLTDWEVILPPPNSMQSALNIMLEGPIGSARYNNEFGRPSICGYFRDFCIQYDHNKYYGYHKPIMLAGGIGVINNKNIYKEKFGEDCLVIVLGGPALLIGLGGGAASSVSYDQNKNKLDYASVQRDNPEMQRRCQEVVNHCWQDSNNPILSIHDVGAGGLANAIPELINEGDCGANLDLNKIPRDDYNLTPLELWANEAQERYVLVIKEQDLDRFSAYCSRENCPFAVLGKTTQSHIKSENKLILQNKKNNEKFIDLQLDVLFGNTPRLVKNILESNFELKESARSVDDKVLFKSDINLEDICIKILSHPTVASKQYLITIGDRSVGGLVARDQMVGKYQIPVADCGVTLTDFNNNHGEAIAIGERTPLAIVNPQAAARMAVAEAITNIISADITSLRDIKLSANWMVASGDDQEDLSLYQSVKAIGEDFCPKLGISIPVGKDSMSMRTHWNGIEVKAPVSLIISAFAPVNNVHKSLTPELCLKDADNTELWLFDFSVFLSSSSDNLLSGTIYTQVTKSFSIEKLINTIDITPELLKNFVDCILELKNNKLLLAYHDRSDGGLWATLCEMAFASQTGLNINICSNRCINKLQINNYLFNEAVGAVVQINKDKLKLFHDIVAKYDLSGYCCFIAEINNTEKININYLSNNLSNGIYIAELKYLQLIWSDTSYQMQRIRDNPTTAEQELASIKNNNHALQVKYNFNIKPDHYIFAKKKPRAAILREQGTNGHIEMAAALMRAGFECVDVHINDIIFKQKSLDQFKFLSFCGGFSYGDVLGAGRGFASRILYNRIALKVFTDFFNRPDTLTLGVCNGCQVLSHLKSIIPGAGHWPMFINNQSEQFEARLSLVKIIKSQSILLNGLADSVLPIVVSHGEGRVNFNNNLNDAKNLKILQHHNLIAMQFVDSQGIATIDYPANPNGSIAGITGLCSDDGRVTLMMPHPERVFRKAQFSWFEEDFEQSDDSPWMRMFYEAYIHAVID